MAEKRHGLNPVADWMLSERAAFKGQASVNGKQGREVQMRMAGPPPACPGHPEAPPAIRNETKPNRQKIKPEIRKRKMEPVSDSTSDSGNESFLESEQPEAGKDAVFAHPEPWKLAARYCGQGGDKFTLNTFSKRCSEVGERAFREELFTFISEVDAGEEVANRGAALNKRLTYLAEATKARKSIRESLDLSLNDGLRIDRSLRLRRFPPSPHRLLHLRLDPLRVRLVVVVPHHIHRGIPHHLAQ